MITNALLVFPKFSANSLWSFQAAFDLAGYRCFEPPLGLLTVAALLPPGWRVRLIDRNAEEVTRSDLEAADVVLTGGMIYQRPDTLSLIDWCRTLHTPVVVGGPDATSCPEVYRNADFLVLGEAEGILDEFLRAWAAGLRSGSFQAPPFQVDVKHCPIPRFDLVTLSHYFCIGVQFSRGCPFKCEFCDIIELYGRVPRTKTNHQMLAELDALYRTGYRGHVDFVDDNFIGNKRDVKRFLPALQAWQNARGFPFKFSTEASINIADDPELLRLMGEANFFAIFSGLESPDTETLIATQKPQNTRRNLAHAVNRIYGAGMYVTAGFIVGFDGEKEHMADAMVACIAETSIPLAMVGLLDALPNTQLTRRLEREGRLLPSTRNEGRGDQCTAGLNFVTRRARRDVLMDHRTIMAAIYAPTAYFSRVRTVGRTLKPSPYALGSTPTQMLKNLLRLARTMWRVTRRIPGVRGYVWRTFLDCLFHYPRNLDQVMTLAVAYAHLGPFSAFVIRELDVRIRALDEESGSRTEPQRIGA